MNLSVCLESADCEENLELLENARIPKVGCDWNSTLSGIIFVLQQYN